MFQKSGPEQIHQVRWFLGNVLALATKKRSMWISRSKGKKKIWPKPSHCLAYNHSPVDIFRIPPAPVHCNETATDELWTFHSATKLPFKKVSITSCFFDSLTFPVDIS